MSAQSLPNRRLASSADAGWTSLLLERHESRGVSAAFDVVATPDQTIVLALRGQHDLDIVRHGRWRTTIQRPGSISTVAPGETCRLRWRSRRADESFETAHLYLPGQAILEAQDGLRRAGQRLRSDRLSALSLRADAAAAVVTGLIGAMAQGAPDLYAEAAIQWLAMHLLWDGGATGPEVGTVMPATNGDRRLSRAIDMMGASLDASLTLDRLAAEAGLSKFHFLRLFRARMGCAPWQYLTQLRMKRARELLVLGDLPIAEVAARCGYRHANNFASAFLRHSGRNPSEYRARAHAGRHL